MKLNKDQFLKQHYLREEDLIEHNISWGALEEIYVDFQGYVNICESQADFISNTLRTHEKIHSVKSRVKNPEHLLEKVIRKTPERRLRYGDEFQFSLSNYKDEITDLIGVRAIHIFKEDWEDIHNFISNTWKVIEITANVREGDDTERFEELDIQIQSRKSGYRSVHYLIESYPTSQKVIAEIQVRTIFEEGYGEIDHQLRYSHNQIPEVLALNLLLLNRIAGSSDEMASLINILNRSWSDMEGKYEKIIDNKNREIEKLKEKIEETDSLNLKEKNEILLSLNKIIMNDSLASLTNNFTTGLNR